MLRVALLLLLIAGLAVLFGTAGFGLAAGSAQIVFYIFLALLLIAVFAALARPRRADLV